MNVVSACPLRVGSMPWRTAAGQWTLTVVAKATFVLLPAESPLAPEQDEPTEADAFWNDDERCSLRAAGDLAPFKRRADVLLVGHAFAPHGQPARSLVARLTVGDVNKSVEAVSDRAFAIDGSLREGLLFVKMPLYWERAAGGPDTTNPVGVRPDVADTRGMTPLPNLQPPGLHVTSRGDYIAPVGFGPIAAWWPTRQGKLHAGLAGWDFRRWSLAPVPADLDPAFFNVAPPDQQLDVIRPNERIVLEHLHAEHPRLVTSLVAARPRALLESPGAAPQEFGMRCDTLCIDTDRGTCTLTWRGQIPLDHAGAGSRVVVTTARDEARRSHTLQADRASRSGDVPADGASAVLPFRVGPGPQAGTVLGAPAAPAAPAAWDATDDDTTSDEPVTAPRGRAFTLPFAAAPRPALPFEAPVEPSAPPAAAPRRAPIDDEDATSVTVQPTRFAAARTPLPPAWSAPPQAIPYAAPVPLDAPRSAVPPAPPPAAFVAWTPLPAQEEPVPPPRMDPPPPAATETPAAPAMIGPLATAEMVAAAEPAPVDTAAALAAPAAPAAPTEPPLPLERYPLERCAAIAASIARTKPDKDRILAEHELEPGTWERLDRHWTETVRAQAGRGRTAPLKAYDGAYVAQLEKERGTIRVEEYARILVAQERGAADDALGALSLPRGALLRVQRLWLGRVSADAELGKSVRAAVDAEREA